MKTDNIILMEMAKESLRGRWGLAIGTFLVYSLIICCLGATNTFGIISLLISGPMAMGAAIFSLSFLRQREAKLEQIFDGFRYFRKALATYLLMLLYIVLWSLLLIVPGIIEALSYSMVFYILVDNPTLKPQEALDMSKKMMYGFKLKLFYLFLRFLLLAFLCVLTFGIGLLWLVPYINITMAEFYEDVKNNAPQFGYAI